MSNKCPLENVQGDPQILQHHSYHKINELKTQPGEALLLNLRTKGSLHFLVFVYCFSFCGTRFVDTF